MLWILAAALIVLGVIGLPGAIIGPVAGAAVGELSARAGLAQAGRAGVAAWVGLLVGTFIMLGIFAIALLVWR